ncbi:hypothetical protein CGCSCA5_v005048 [Colletotrichum siamense]|nr:hypothetical protein CGCSCA5_v005048 [Colletotrichum siamense]
MADKQKTKERPAQRSLTPNRNLYSSFNEAHRNIAPPTPKLPFETVLGNGQRLTQEQLEQVEQILSDANRSKDSEEPESKVRTEETELPSTSTQSGNGTNFTTHSAQSAVEAKRETICKDPRASSVYPSDDEYAFIDTSISSLPEAKAKQEQPHPADDPFASRNALDNWQDSSSIYPEDAVSLGQVSDDEPVPEVKLEPKSSPIMASRTTLPPPVATSSQDRSQQDPQSHFDDLPKWKDSFGYFDSTQLSSQNVTRFPIFLDPFTGCSPAFPRMPQPQPQPQPVAKAEETKTEAKYDGQASKASESWFNAQDNGTASSSRLNPFHAFSGCSSQESEDDDFEELQSKYKEEFTRLSAEKEVSQALRHVTGISQPSSGLVVNRTRSSHTHDLRNSPYNPAKTQQQGFYHAPAIQPSWKVTSSGVKVPVANQHHGPDDINTPAAEPYSAIDNTNMAAMASTADERAGFDGEEDWRTVTDDREFPTGAVGRVMTGSSIANVSDRVLIQHPNAHEARRAPSATGPWWKRTAGTQPVTSPLSPFPNLGFPTPPQPTVPPNRRQQDWHDVELDSLSPSLQHPGSRPRSDTGETFNGLSQSKFPFPLVSREDASRIQAVRRASGLEDHTLSGSLVSPTMRPNSSIQDSSYGLSRPDNRKDSAHSQFSQTKNGSYHETFSSHRQNTWGNQPTSGLPARPSPLQERAPTAASGKAARVTHRAAADALANQRAREGSPHLFTREGARVISTDVELAGIAGPNMLSERAQRRSKLFYRGVMAITLIIPFVGWAMTSCRADSMLAAITQGECSGLSHGQRRNMRMMMFGGFALWCIAVVVVLIITAATRH